MKKSTEAYVELFPTWKRSEKVSAGRAVERE